jgi:hypothetical protein
LKIFNALMPKKLSQAVLTKKPSLCQEISTGF